MNLTQKLKGWLTENCEVPETASDQEFKQAAALAVMEDKLGGTKLAELTDEDGPDPVDMLAKAIGQELDKRLPKQEGSKVLGSALESALANVKPEDQEPKKETASARAARMFGKSDPSIRVKSPIEQYSSTKGALVYPKGDKHWRDGQPVEHCGQILESTSQADKAVAGAFLKWAMCKGARRESPDPRIRLTEHDEQLVEYALREVAWTGILRGTGTDDGGTAVMGTKLADWQRKTLLDDSTSGGLEIVPIAFDAAIITTPVLFGEFYPLVKVIPITRGRRIEGGKIGNITVTSGPAEGTAMTPFNTASMVSALDTTIFNATAAIEIGNDFQDDSPVNAAQIIIEKAGEKFMEWLDNQICNGDGTTEPQGLLNASGTTDIGNPAGGAGTAAQVNDYEALLFNVGKEYQPRSQWNQCVFGGNLTTYRRARAIYVGAADARRVFGMDERSYTILDAPFKIQGSIGNASCFFANLNYYRMYRRVGLNVKTETGGRELTLKNQTLIVLRARFGGQLELGGAMSWSDNWQA